MNKSKSVVALHKEVSVVLNIFVRYYVVKIFHNEGVYNKSWYELKE